MTTISTLLPEKDTDSDNRHYSEVSTKSLLYIGKSLTKTSKCLSLFKSSFQAFNFLYAKILLQEQFYGGNQCPDLIIIDLPFDKEKVLEFINWLNAMSWSCNTPIIYQEDITNLPKLKELLRLKIIDDIVNIESYCNKLHEKAVFLKKTKTFLNQSKQKNLIKKDSLNLKKEVNNIGNKAMKRGFDIFIALSVLVLLSPVFILIVLLIKIESRGPAIYKSKRAGKGFRIFNFYKFRTMVADADQKLPEMAELNIYDKADNAPAFFKVVNDPRITKVGSFLRNTSLDELPQLINVLKGEMSIVGNRPLPLYEASSLTTDKHAERFMAPAGITGLWQITKRGNKDMSSEERLTLDINYARNHNFIRDFKILLHTPLALIQKTNV